MDPTFKADLNKYICDCKLRLQKILQALEWTEEDTLKDFNTNSIASCSKSSLQKCPPTSKSTFPRSCLNENSLVLETPELQALLNNNKLKAPDNFQELQSSFSREQKLKIYEHVIANTQKLDNNLVEEEVEGELSLTDILAQKKSEDKKKKRRFRKSKPTHIEEVRCLVDLQMQAFEQFIGNKALRESNIEEQKVRLKEDKNELEINSFKDNYCNKSHGKTIKEKRDIKDDAGRSSGEMYHHKHKHHKRSLSVEAKEFRRKRRRSLSSSENDQQHKNKRKHKSKDQKESSHSKSFHKKDKKRQRSKTRSRSHEKKFSKEKYNVRKSSRTNSSERVEYQHSSKRRKHGKSESYGRGEKHKHHKSRKEYESFGQRSQEKYKSDKYKKESDKPRLQS